MLSTPRRQSPISPLSTHRLQLVIHSRWPRRDRRRLRQPCTIGPRYLHTQTRQQRCSLGRYLPTISFSESSHRSIAQSATYYKRSTTRASVRAVLRKR